MTVTNVAEQTRRWAGKIQPVRAAYAGVVVLFLFALGQFYIPGTGFTYLIGFGGNLEAQRLSKLRQLDYYVAQQSYGYDAQYYAQMALDPSLTNTQLKQAVDNLSYRGRRILMSATAYVLGLGKPVRIVQAFALINALCWLVLAAVLLHWFPPRSWENFLRWTGVLFAAGLALSVRYALIDGPSLLLIAGGVLLLDKGRPWLGSLVLAIGGLGKETNLLGGTALLPAGREGPRAWLLAGLRGLLLVAPLALWMVYLTVVVGPATDVGDQNFGLPFVAYFHKWREVLTALPTLSYYDRTPLYGLLLLATLTVQFLYLVLCPQWQKAWWRIGASFALLMIFLGDAVWEGYPGAGARVLLPMQLAFNVLVPSGRGWRVLLLAGNLSLLVSLSALEPPAGPGGVGFKLSGSPSVLANDAGKAVIVKFSREWYGTESGSNSNYWTWTSGDAAISIVNPHRHPLQVHLRFGVSAISRRVVRLRLGGEELWQATIPAVGVVNVTLGEVVLQPGMNRLEFVSDSPAQVTGSDARSLSFNVRNLRIEVQRELPP
ncbi:MAG: DUF2029 domain-containing protein [Opitutae bacterium]|nr:DUF2029 domain-containing protein [Opitutae bacterium]